MNAELIAELRGHIREVPLTLLRDAADALEAAEKRISELEKQHGNQLTRNIMLRARIPKEGEWIECGRLEGKTVLKCSVCSQGITDMFAPKYHYCPNCGARMRTVTDCHTLEEGEHDG